jgi:hypothetical protein
MKNKIIPVAYCIFVWSACGTQSRGAVIDVTASGSIFEVGSAATGVTSVGETFFVTFTYDSSVLANYDSGTDAYYDSVSEYTLTLQKGAAVYSGVGGEARIRISNNYGVNQLDGFRFETLPNPNASGFPNVAGAGLQYLLLNITNLGGAPLASTGLPASVSLADFSNRRLQVSWLVPNAHAQGTMTSLNFTPRPVPEPGSFMLLGVSCVAGTLTRRRR